LAPLARYWIAEYSYRHGDFYGAETNYVMIGTNGSSGLRWQSRLMAAKAAFLRDRPSGARYHLTNLLNDTTCPPDLMAQAYVMLGDVASKEAETAVAQNQSQSMSNIVRQFEEAITSFDVVLKIFPTNSLEPLARGKIANCYFQLAGLDTNRYAYTLAVNEYNKVMTNSIADVSTRSHAEVGLANALEKQADQQPAAEQKPLLERALNHCLNVVYKRNVRVERGELADPFWVKRAGLRAGQIAERLRMFDQAIELYAQLQAEIPQMRAELESKVEALKRERKKSKL
jgi:tetratricopeptide (TPR) repeat protein